MRNATRPLEKKLQNAEKREDTEATKARSALAAATVLSSTATTTVEDSNAVDSPSVDRSIIPLVSSETEKIQHLLSLPTLQLRTI